MLVQGTWALAGTTGGLQGIVTDSETGAPVAGASVTVTSPSQTATQNTNGSGHFVFLSLQPDTYTVSVTKTGYNETSQSGLSVFADNVITYDARLIKALKTIAAVRSVAAGALVKSGVTQDTYSINAATAQKAAALGGGGNLDNAYSAIASVPGVNVPMGGQGWNNNSVFIRGAQQYFSGFEFDGVPVNRAFDNYNASTESNLGLGELQVYTGGGPASDSSAGTSGFINQVIKTGTFPGFGLLAGGVGTPTYYHQGRAEAGGATPNRNFSYYVGISGVNQDFRFIDNNNGGSIVQAPNVFATYSTAPDLLGATFGQGVLPLCNLNDNNLSAEVGTLFPHGCLYGVFGNYGNVSHITDRENVVNLHFGIPHRNGALRDDLQLLWSASSLNTAYYSGVNDTSTNPVNFWNSITGGFIGPYCPASGSFNGAPCSPISTAGCLPRNPTICSPAYPDYSDAIVYNAPFGANIGNTSPQLYYQPSSNANRAPNAALPFNERDTIWNDTGIVKAQYTHALSDRAFVRIFGYTFFSDWTQAGAPNSFALYQWGFGGPGTGVAENYDLITHTAGGQLQIADQITDKHLLQFTGNYTTAKVTRFNNSGYAPVPAAGQIVGSSPLGLLTTSNGVFTCYDSRPSDAAYGTPIACTASHANFGGGAANIGLGNTPNSVAAAAPCMPACIWSSKWDGNARGSFNTVRPDFSFLSLTDQWRPSDRWLFNLGVRFENYKYNLPDSTTTATRFYSQEFANFSCYDPVNKILALTPLGPNQPPPQAVLYVTGLNPNGTPLPCSTLDTTPGQFDNFVHPNGTAQLGFSASQVPSFTAASPGAYTLQYWSPRVSGTYTQSPDTVWRFSAGRFTEPPISASVQYLNRAGDQRSVWGSSVALGFFSPFHPIPAMSSTQADLSFEHHFRGTDMSLKLSPFIDYITGYQEQSFIGQNFVTQIPIGDFRSQGVEFAFTKGDFNREGLSGALSVTYVSSQEKFRTFFGQNQLSIVNNAIAQYNVLADPALGASQCYSPFSAATGVGGGPVACTAPGAVFNPYFGHPQPLMKDQWYPAASNVLAPGLNTSAQYYDVPWVASLILNWRHQKLAITPSLQWQAGSAYGNPLNVVGQDPRTCGANQLATAVPGARQDPATGAFYCDYTTQQALSASSLGILYIPNPQTAGFDTFGAYRNPSIMTGNLQISYDVSPRVTAQVTLTSLFHTCFGGTKTPWTAVYSPGSLYCGYVSNQGLYVANDFNGPSPTAAASNGGVTPQPWQLQSYSPRTFNNGESFGAGYVPFNAYFQLQVKL